MNPADKPSFWQFGFKFKSKLAKRGAFRPSLGSMESRIVPTFSFQLDLAFDRSVNVTAGRGFITQAMLDLANEAANSLAAKFQDTLSELPLQQYRIPNPTNPNVLTSVTTGVAANRLLVYMAGAPLSGKSESYSYSDFNAENKIFRGQKDDDFAPNVSVISLDNDGTTHWDVDSEIGRAHFKGVITHELIHAMGMLKKQPTWSGQIKNGLFIGNEVKNLFPAGLPVEPGLNPVHFAAETASLMTAQGAGDDIADVTAIDVAVLKDLGWEPVANQFSRLTAQPILFTGEKPILDFETKVDLEKLGGRALYRFEALNGFQYEFNTSFLNSVADPNVDTYLRLFDSKGAELASNDDDTASASFSRLAYHMEKGGTYYIGVSLFSNKNYFLSDSKRGSKTDVGKFTLSGKMTDPFDIGGSIASAKILSDKSFDSGPYESVQSLSSQYDVDMYKIQLAPYETITATTSFTGTAGERKVDSYLRLFCGEGREILRSDDGGGDNYARLSFTTKTGGDYFIGVSSTLNRGYSPNGLGEKNGRFGGDYLLSLNRQMALPIVQTDPNVPTGTHYLDVSYLSAVSIWFVIQNDQGHSILKPQKWGQWDPSATWLDINTGDFNGDGLIDRIGRTSTGQWWMAKNLGSSFQSVYLGSWNESLGYQDVLVGNFYDESQNGPKIMDLAARDAPGTWFVFPLDSGGISESKKRTFATVTSGGEWKNVTALDYDSNGYADVIGRDVNGSWKLLKNNGSSFSQVIVGHWNKKVDWRDVKFADFSGDGLVDIAGREANGQWWISTNIQGDEFTSSPAWKWNEAAGWRDVMLGDFVGDSRLDIIGRTAKGEWWVAPAGDAKLSILPVSSRANANPLASRKLGKWKEAGQWTSTVLVGNFIGGGKADLVGLTKDGEWWVSQNTGTGLVSSSFFADKKLATPVPVHSAAAGFFVTATLESAGQFSQGGLPPVFNSLRSEVDRSNAIDQALTDWSQLGALSETGTAKNEDKANGFWPVPSLKLRKILKDPKSSGGDSLFNHEGNEDAEILAFK